MQPRRRQPTEDLLHDAEDDVRQGVQAGAVLQLAGLEGSQNVPPRANATVVRPVSLNAAAAGQRDLPVHSAFREGAEGFWFIEGDAKEFVERPADLRPALAQADLGVTGVELAVAETGTLVLRSAAGQPRSTSLLPACHIALFDRSALSTSRVTCPIVRGPARSTSPTSTGKKLTRI